MMLYNLIKPITGTKCKKTSLISSISSNNLARGIGALLLLGTLAGGLTKIIQNMSKKKQQKMKIDGGVYGAVAIARAFKGADFPMSKQDIMEKYGDVEIEYRLGKREKLKDVLQNVPEQTFNRTTDLEHAFHESMEKE